MSSPNLSSNSLTITGSSISGESPMVTLAGVQVASADAMILASGVSAAANYDSFKYNGVAYQVPVGKKLVVKAMKVYTLTAVATQAYWGYANVSKSNAAGSPAGETFLSVATTYTGGLITSATALSFYEIPIPDIEIPAGKYPFTFSPAQASLTYILCTLEDA